MYRQQEPATDTKCVGSKGEASCTYSSWVEERHWVGRPGMHHSIGREERIALEKRPKLYISEWVQMAPTPMLT